MIPLIVVGTTMIGAAMGGIIGAAVQTTKKGKEINDKLEHDWDKYKDDIKQIGLEIGKKTIEHKK